MQIFDIVMAVCFVGSIILGAWKGMLWQICMVSSIVVSFFAAREFHGGLAEAISDIGSPLNQYLSMGAVYILTSLAIWVIHSFLQKRIVKHEMKSFDHQTGALMGIVNGALLCSILTVTMVAFTSDESHSQIAESKTGIYVDKMVAAVRNVLPPDIAEPVNKHFDRLHSIIQQRGTEEEIDQVMDETINDLKDEIRESLE
ncbi:MAG: CvpA family protein [Planctomycetaceae bacterium]|nr:hypothetical protein [Planctomycetaceae bacterium]